MGLWSGGDLAAVVGSCGGGVVLEAPLDGGGGGVMVLTALLGGSGGGDGHTSDPVLGDPWSVSLALVHGARVPMGLPLGPIWILIVCLYASLGGESSTGMTSTGSSSSSSSVAVTYSAPSSPPPSDSVMTTPSALVQPGKGTCPGVRGSHWCMS
jgi:hypothetical protein